MEPDEPQAGAPPDEPQQSTNFTDPNSVAPPSDSPPPPVAPPVEQSPVPVPDDSPTPLHVLVAEALSLDETASAIEAELAAAKEAEAAHVGEVQARLNTANDHSGAKWREVVDGVKAHAGRSPELRKLLAGLLGCLLVALTLGCGAKLRERQLSDAEVKHHVEVESLLHKLAAIGANNNGALAEIGDAVERLAAEAKLARSMPTTSDRAVMQLKNELGTLHADLVRLEKACSAPKATPICQVADSCSCLPVPTLRPEPVDEEAEEVNPKPGPVAPPAPQRPPIKRRIRSGCEACETAVVHTTNYRGQLHTVGYPPACWRRYAPTPGGGMYYRQPGILGGAWALVFGRLVYVPPQEASSAFRPTVPPSWGTPQ